MVNESIIGGGIFIFLLFAILGIGTMILWIWSLIDCATKESSEGNDKLIWILVIVFAGWIGSLIYIFARRPQRIKDFGQ